MNKIYFFISGLLAGIVATLFVVLRHFPDHGPVASRVQPTNTTNITTEQALSSVCPSIPEPACDLPTTLKPSQEPNSKTANQAELLSLLQAFNSNTASVFERDEYKDLAYLVGKNKNLADMVRSMILESETFEEKNALINVLSQDRSQETINFVVELIGNPDDETKRLGYELLGLMNPKESPLELSDALLDASYDENNPEFLKDVIYRLSETNLDEMSKTVAVERFQSFLTNESNTIKADAIGGLSLLADQDTIRNTAKEFIHHADERVRVSAIGSLFKLETDYMDEEIIGSLRSIAKNPEDSESARNIAAAVLESKNLTK